MCCGIYGKHGSIMSMNRTVQVGSWKEARVVELLEEEHKVLLDEEAEHRVLLETRISLLLEVVRLLLENLPRHLDLLRLVLCLHLHSLWDQEIPEHRIPPKHLVLPPQHSATLHPHQHSDNPNPRSAQLRQQPPRHSVNQPPPPSPPNHPSSAPHPSHLPPPCPP